MPTEVKLGEETYKVPEMDLGQIEEITLLERKDNPKWSFQVLAILMRDATPKIEDFRKVKTKLPQIAEAINKILTDAGFEIPNPQAPAQPGPASSEADAS